MNRSLENQTYQLEVKRKSLFMLSMKRMMDILVSLVGITLTSPIMLIVAVCIKFEDKGPAIFVQTRTGKDDKLFSIYKFRSMKVNKEKTEKPQEPRWDNGVPDDFMFKKVDEIDPNVTKIGAFIRKTSLDELPQLFNVLLGNMSIVGPRPEIPSITSCYNKKQKQRLIVKPGITGWAQVNGRSDITNGEKMSFDYYYIKNQSISLDLAIIWKTIKVVLTSKGAV
ncbi:sugar transferase [Listeria seeligeri]|uniref:sugar transferase n=1 Tax=Listeria seeligeri TaxID=1640 RepID=UPI0017B992A0|nr:sugar transferase [Listeria seeligeri]MBC1826622.1 sugar transferase [Listeria seeligeri]MBC1870026.1 sugar transferase [Listeria seeligeri]MBM5598044.1 sugar transferase [Listeria seeligeri]MBM5606499.1 sugar transferase [Listeria seeligeri]MBM5611944.1 sugar transferase [Listeria seeligeri]